VSVVVLCAMGWMIMEGSGVGKKSEGHEWKRRTSVKRGERVRMHPSKRVRCLFLCVLRDI
jgi:hypothetical protein